MRIFVGIPAYDGKLGIETVRSLLNEQVAAVLKGHEIQFGLLPGGSLITSARDQVARDFMVSGFDRLAFVDADVSWEPGDLVKLAEHPVDFVAGAYRYKNDPEGYPVTWLDRPELWADPETGLIEVSSAPAGFLVLSRAVFEAILKAHPGRVYDHQGQSFFAYFWAPPGSGEDGQFCHEWRQTGGKVWLDPTLTLGHTGGFKTYTGNIGQWLKNRP